MKWHKFDLTTLEVFLLAGLIGLFVLIGVRLYSMVFYLLAAFNIFALMALIIFLLIKMRKKKNESTILTRSLEVFLNQTSDFIYYKDRNSRFIFCSQTLADITNHKHWKDMIGKHDFEVFPHDLAAVYNEEEKPVFEEGKPLLNKVNPYYSVTGEKRYVHTNKWPVFDKNNNVNGIFGISRDITEHKNDMDALEKERDLFAEGPVFNMEWDSAPYGNWSVKYASSNAEKILGYSPAEMVLPEFSYSDIIHPDDKEGVINRLKHNIENNIDFFEESYRLKTKAGQYLWIYDFTSLVRNEEGIMTSFRSYLYDQSAQKRSEEALRLAEARLEKTAYDLTENIPVGTYTMVQPADGGMAKFAFMSSRFLELAGLTREEAAEDTLKVFARAHPDDYDEWVAKNARAFAEKTPFFGETRIIVNGETRWVKAESTPRAMPDGSTVWEGVLSDITDRKLAEEALSESVSRFNDLVAHVSVGVYIFWNRADGRTEFEYVSDSWCKMTNIRREDLLADPSHAFNIIHPDDMESFMALNREVVRERKRFSWEGRMVIDGKTSFALIESTPVFFENGESRWFGIHQDITDRKQAEEILRKSEAKLHELNVQKDKFFSIIAHDLKSPFNAIMGFSELLLEQVRTQDYEGIDKFAGIIMQSSKRAMNLLSNLLQWAYSQTGKMVFDPEHVLLRQLIKDGLLLFDNIATEKSITIKNDVPESLIIFADKSMISTVLRNLISNAIKFTREGGEVVISARQNPKDILVSIKDNGIGIAPGRAKQLFSFDTNISTPGTNKEKGTGLGLILSKEFVEKHGGSIWVESKEGKGSTFSFTLSSRGQH